MTISPSSFVSLVIAVFSVMLITASSPMGGWPKPVLGPALQLDASHRLGHALGANRVRTALEGETLLRLRHAAAHS